MKFPPPVSMMSVDAQRERFEKSFSGVDVSFERDRFSHAYKNGALEIMWQTERNGVIERLQNFARSVNGTRITLTNEERGQIVVAECLSETTPGSLSAAVVLGNLGQLLAIIRRAFPRTEKEE